MPSMLDSHTRARMLQRLALVSADQSPRWGGMTAAQMVAHLDVQTRNPMLLWFIIEVMPWPRGKLLWKHWDHHLQQFGV